MDKKYPFADYSRFYYVSEYGGVYYKDPNTGESTLVDSEEFWSNPKYSHWLIANKDSVHVATAKIKFKEYPTADFGRFVFEPFKDDVLMFYKTDAYQSLANSYRFPSVRAPDKPDDLNVLHKPDDLRGSLINLQANLIM